MTHNTAILITDLKSMLKMANTNIISIIEPWSITTNLDLV